MGRPENERLYHATPTHNVEHIMRNGLEPTKWVTPGHDGEIADPVNLSTEDESDLIAFFSGCLDADTDEVTDTVTLLEVDVRGISLEWPGIDGDHHYTCAMVIPPERIRVVKTNTLAEVVAAHEGVPMTSDKLDEMLGAMEKTHAAWERRGTV